MSARPHHRAERGLWWGIGLVGLAALLWVADLGHGTDPADGAWFVQVLDRVGGGDELYGEVFLGVPPLAVWLGLPFTEALGSEIAVLKALSAVAGAGIALLAAGIALRVGVERAGAAAVALTSLAYLLLPSGALYTSLSYLLALLALALALAWRAGFEVNPRRARTLLVLAGVAAGLAAGAKHSEGGYATAALMLSVVLASPRPAAERSARLRDGLLVLAAAATAFCVVLSPVVLAGSLDDFVRYVLGKGPFLELGSVSYLDNLDGLAALLSTPGANTRALLLHTGVLLPPVAVLALVLAARHEPRTAIVLGLFLLAAIAGAFPRADLPHVLPAVPISALVISWSAKRIIRQPSSRLAKLAVGVTIAGLLVVAGWTLTVAPLRSLGNDDRVSRVAPSSLVLVDPGFAALTERVAGELAAADRGEGRTMLLSPYAGYLYLSSGLDSPSRFDYPLASTFRAGDEAELIARIRDAEIERVCVGGLDSPGIVELRPHRLLRYVETRMHRVGSLAAMPDVAQPPACTLYSRSRPPHAGSGASDAS